MNNGKWWKQLALAGTVACLMTGRALGGVPNVPAPIPAVPGPVKFGFVGLHGGMFETFREHAKALNVQVEYITDEAILATAPDLSSFTAVFLQHAKIEAKPHYEAMLKAARAKNPRFRAYTCSGEAGNSWSIMMPGLVKDGTLVNDLTLQNYYNANKENLRRFLGYALVNYAGRPGTVEPPVETETPVVYHPDHPEGFPGIPSFLAWAAQRRGDLSKLDRAVVIAHPNHLMFQQPKVVDALIREFDRRGVLAVCLTDGASGTPTYEDREFEFKPGIIVHTCCSKDDQAKREKLGVSHLSSLFDKAQAIDLYLTPTNMSGLNGRGNQIVAQEIKGTTPPLYVAGTLRGGGSDEELTPVPERVEHLAARACAILQLQKTPPARRKVAFIYYDREMGKSELMRGTPTGMFMNAPRSMVGVLKRLGEEGYTLQNPPQNEDDLLALMKDHGRQVGVWAPAVLDRLARSGNAVLIPAETYRRWYAAKVPEVRRRDLERQWGPPPGNFLVWKDDAGKAYIVVPRLDLGNVILLPQPLRGEAHTAAALGMQTHDKLTPPPHNYLATYFWLQEGFPADAVVHFGTHGSEFLLPGKADALVQTDWCDIIFGRLPNISVWIINNLGESVPVKRRTYATIVDHLTPPVVEAELSDALKNLQSDIEKWERVEDGALKGKLLQTIGAQIVKLNLDRDLKLDLAGDRPPTVKDVEAVSSHLEMIANEATPVSLHVFGQVPPTELLIPYYVRCAGKKFLDGLGPLLPPSLGPGREMAVRKKAEEMIRLMVENRLAPAEALQSVGAKLPPGGSPKVVAEGLAMLVRLHADLQKTGHELTGLLTALDGRFVPPGPANSPDRNPGSVPTGRNMFVVNPEEIPTPAAWEIGKQLIDALLKEESAKNGNYPNKVAFSLSPGATYRDFGVIEAQILYLMGLRPVWDARRLVSAVEVIPAKELGRPRIDVFIHLRGLYRDQLPTRMQLIDRAVRMAALIDEPDNYVRQNTRRAKGELAQGGLAPEKADYLSLARMFGMPPGQMGSGWYYYLVQKTGNWNSREDLLKLYLEHNMHAYTANHWGENAPEAYRSNIQGAEIVIRSWADNVSSPLSNKYTWYIDGSLSMAVKQLTGREPKYYFADVRDPSRVRMVSAEDAINTDFQVRIFNRKWIEGMMKEGYAGADQVKVQVSNMLGWKIMRDGAIRDDQWNEVVEVYVHDSKKVQIREWFDQENPHAFQNVTHLLMEAARKGYWRADPAVLKELAAEYAKSVVKYGPDGGLRTGGNAPFEAFLHERLDVPGDAKARQLLADYQAAMAREAAPAATDPAPPAAAVPPVPARTPPAVTPPPPAVNPVPKLAPAVPATPKTKPVTGRELTRAQPPTWWERLLAHQLILGLALSGVLILVSGFLFRQGVPGPRHP
jgi:cobaltochelatase CobN